MSSALTTLPEGACDCHIHAFEDGYALAPTATFKPPHAPAASYLAVRQPLGLMRAVVVQPTGYGFDNRCTLDAMKQLGTGTRGIAVVAPDVSDAGLNRLHQAGIRGVRYMMLAGGVLPWDSLEGMAARIAPLGWNINLQLDGRDLPFHDSMLSRLPCRLVIDHIVTMLTAGSSLQIRRGIDMRDAQVAKVTGNRCCVVERELSMKLETVRRLRSTGHVS